MQARAMRGEGPMSGGRPRLAGEVLAHRGQAQMGKERREICPVLLSTSSFSLLLLSLLPVSRRILSPMGPPLLPSKGMPPAAVTENPLGEGLLF